MTAGDTIQEERERVRERESTPTERGKGSFNRRFGQLEGRNIVNASS